VSAPTVSIIIPAFNAARWIGDAIESVRIQTLPDWELIIANDGSTDGTARAARSFLSDTRIALAEQIHAGVSAARNAGLKLARGRFIGFLDADDGMEPNNLERKIDVLEAHPDVDWVFADLHVCDAGLRKTGDIFTGTDEGIVEKILLSFPIVVPAPCSNVIARRRCFDEGVRLDPNLSAAADQDFALQLGSRYKALRIPEVLGSYRVLSNSMSRDVALFERDSVAFYNKVDRLGMFASKRLRRVCYSNLYFRLARRWWIDGKNKALTLKFIWKCISTHPPNAKRFLGIFGGEAFGDDSSIEGK
jgi:glycosyltransferase involved in cell wall biosynthesis